MTSNALVTGPPRSGKSTALKRALGRLEADGYRAGGIHCPEICEEGTRVGFSIADVYTGDSRVLAHVDATDGPTVGKYTVCVENVDAVCRSAFDRAFDEADVLVIDEIAPMETYSDVFEDVVRRAIGSDRPLLAAIHERSEAGVIGWVKDRRDVEHFAVTPESRDELPRELAAWARQRLA